MAAMWSFLLGLALAADPAAEALDAVVLVVQGSSTCSGALIDARGRIATAYHCVASGGRPRVQTRGGKRVVGRVVAVDPGHDLAVIDAPELAGEPWLELREGVPELGEEVSALGHPFGVSAPAGFMEGTLRWSLTRGVVSAVGPYAIQFSAPINPGNSGGPVVDASGALIAVVSRRTGGSEGLGFGGRADRLRAMAAEDPHAMGPIGGTWAVQPVLSVWQGQHGVFSTGGRLQIAIRDRVVLGGTVRFGLNPRFGALEFDAVRFLGPAGRVALRQRFGRGRFALRADLWGEASALWGFDATIRRGDVDLDRVNDWVPLVGGQLAIGTAGFDLGCSPLGHGCAASLVINWPGVLGVF